MGWPHEPREGLSGPEPDFKWREFADEGEALDERFRIERERAGDDDIDDQPGGRSVLYGGPGYDDMAGYEGPDTINGETGNDFWVNTDHEKAFREHSGHDAKH